MESQLATELAADILLDHFGHVAQRVGFVLLERGELSMQHLLRFVNQSEDFIHGPLNFIQVRDALRVLVQHNLVMAVPSVPAERGQVVPQMYSIDSSEVLSRMRFSRYLEYADGRYGDIAFQLLSSVLRQGRVSRSIAFSEAQQHCAQEVGPADIDGVLARLLQDNLLRVVKPYMAQTQETTPGVGSEEHVKNAGLKRKTPGSDGETPKSEAVYRANTQTFNLCLVKMLLCKHLEDATQNKGVAKVLDALLSEVAIKPCAVDEQKQQKPELQVNGITFPALEERMKELDHIEGRDPAREQSELRKTIDIMAAQGNIVNGQQQRTLLKSRATNTDKEWRVDWTEAKTRLKSAASSQLIRNKFGAAGLRIFNLLNNVLEQGSPNKLEDAYIFRTCMVDPAKGRETLNSMVRNHFVKWQQVAKSPDAPLLYCWWLYYVDRMHVELTIIRDVLQAILNLRVRYRAEVKAGARLDALPVTTLSRDERCRREECYQKQDILERSYLVMDSVLLAFGDS